MSAAARAARHEGRYDGDLFAAAVSQAAADRRAYQIADQAAVADIESNCLSVRDASGQLWHDTRPMLDEREHCAEAIDMNRAALEHAAARGLIERRLSAPHIVRIKLPSHPIFHPV